ncbi:DUF4827 domain-containing protein [Phocaeicola abscessus]|uniref:DUF4827 domain-containing protein n=1 Tax=Phocaeicola abscessus TaxID=555313 RepID=UPI000558AFB6|nr:DUF4827 domain-containing protein [Phocaeicola abscessus]
MSKWRITFVMFVLLLAGQVFQACNRDKTYAELKEDERKAIDRFIDLQHIKIISEEEFLAKDTATDVSANEFVLFKGSGAYMQIVERGNGKLMDDGRHEILARYKLSRIYKNGIDSLYSYNLADLYPDEMTVQKSGTSFSGQFTTGVMLAQYSETSLPGGWLIPFRYIKTGRLKSDRAKVRIIIPHTQNNLMFQNYVYPCYLEVTYQLGR